MRRKDSSFLNARQIVECRLAREIKTVIFPVKWPRHIGNDCTVESCILENCIIEYGGGNLSWPANIYCEGSSPTIKNCQVNFSGHWGIFRSNFAKPDLTGTIFMGNRDGDLWP